MFTGARRVPQDTLRALIATKKGDIYNEDDLHRDFMALWNTRPLRRYPHGDASPARPAA